MVVLTIQSQLDPLKHVMQPEGREQRVPHISHVYCALTLPGDDVREKFTEEGGILELSGRKRRWPSEGRRERRGSLWRGT